MEGDDDQGKTEAGAGICSRLPRRTGARCWHLREGCPIRGENAGQGARGQRSSTIALTTAGRADRLQQKHRLRLQSAGGASDTEQSSAAREQRRPASGEHVRPISCAPTFAFVATSCGTTSRIAHHTISSNRLLQLACCGYAPAHFGSALGPVWLHAALASPALPPSLGATRPAPEKTCME